jgi:uncharacterized protein YuzE
MRVTYDPSVDAAYIYLREVEPGGIKESVDIDAPEGVAAGSVVVDFDHEGRMVGIEVLNARRCLPKHFLDGAERPGQRHVTSSDAD